MKARDDAYAAIDRAMAYAYETGFLGGLKDKERVTSVIESELVRQLHDVLDRLQLVRQMLATHDTRYSLLGEIIRDFAALVGLHDVDGTLVNTIRADHIAVGDLVEMPGGDGWQRVESVGHSHTERQVWFVVTGGMRRTVGEGDSLRVKRLP